MKFGISAQGDNLETEMDWRFGRCANFIFVDSESLEFQTVPNPAASAPGGAGVKAGQLMVERKAEVILTGNIGPNAFEILKAAEIKVITGVKGKVKEVIEKYKNGELKPGSGPSVNEKYGMS